MDMDPNKSLRFVPLPFGTFFLMIFVVGTFFMTCDNLMDTNLIMVVAHALAFAPLSHTLRNYHDSLLKLGCQLREFTMNDSKCYCCTVRHVHPDTGARIPCDRDVVKTCIDSWFGSSVAFDAFVQHSLFDKVGIGRPRVPFDVWALSCLPRFWGNLDKIAVRLGQRQWHGALLYFGNMVVDLVVMWPVWFACFWAATYIARRRLSSRCADITSSLCVAIVSRGLALVLVILSIHVTKALGPLAIIAVCCLIVLPVSLVCGVRARCPLPGACAHGSMFSRQQPIHTGAGADLASDAAVNVVGRGSDQPHETDWEDFTLDIRSVPLEHRITFYVPASLQRIDPH
jgi:hypothetical protein